jgi:alpha-glucosidase (family GH31 glycosyl hydrolase)
MHRYTFEHTPIAHADAVVGGQGQFRFTVLADGLLRFEWADDGQFEDRASVIAVNRRMPVPLHRLKETDASLEIITSRFHMTYDKKAFSPSGLTAAVKGSYGAHSSVWHYGSGNATLGGTARTLDDVNGRTEIGSGIVSRLGFASLNDSSSMLFDENQWPATRRPGNRVDGYLFAYGHDYRTAVKAFYQLSGPQPLLPQWALGNWWSRYHAYDEKEYLQLMDTFKSQGIPLSVAVLDMDWHLVDDPRIAKAGVTGWTGYTWNKDLFPEPAEFLEKLHGYGVKTSLNVHPADGVHSYEDLYQDMAAALGHDTSQSDPILFDITSKKFLDAYFDVLHRKIEQQGVDLWWVDWQQGVHSRIPGIDPLWVLNHFHFLDSSHANKRPLTFSRYAGPGSHRYPIGFSGDTFITWDSLNFQPEFTSTASNIGYGWWSHDIGGHMHGQKDNELLVRWVQYGVFSPILRLHSSNNLWNVKEPWNIDVESEPILTKFLRLRHRLLPYLYTMNVRATIDSVPLIQPMYWEYPEKEEAYQVPNQYMYGSELMIAPITTPRDRDSGLGEVLTWFPPARYVDIFNGMVYDGGRKLWVARPLDEYPVFAREGSIIPLDAHSEPANDRGNPDALELVVIVGADGRFELIEDDGTGASAEKVQFNRTMIHFAQQTGQLKILPGEAGSSQRSTRSWTVRLPGFAPEKDLKFLVNGDPQEVHHEESATGTVVSLGYHGFQNKLTIYVGENPQLRSVSPTAYAMKFIRQAKMEMDLKDKIWDAIANRSSKLASIGDLIALDLESSILNPLLECLLASS